MHQKGVAGLGGARLLPVLAVVGSTACFQIGAAFAKGLYPAVGPIGAATLRLFFAALILLAILRPWRSWPANPPWLALLGLGTCVAGGILFFYLAIDHLPMGVAISIQSLGPLALATIMSSRLSQLFWIALAGVGVWCLVGPSGGTEPIEFIGIGFALIAAASWAGYIIFGGRAARAFGQGVAALSVGLAALIVVPIGVAQVGSALFSPALIPLGILVAILSGALPFSLELYALPRLPARSFAVLTCLEPAFASLFGLLMLGEVLGVVQTIGVALVITASMGAVWSGAANRDPKER